MKEVYDPKLKARMSVDESGQVRAISHSQEYWEAEQEDPVEAAVAYLRDVAGVLGVQETELANPRENVDFFTPVEKGVEYRLSDVKQRFDSTTVSFYQTYLNIPVWRAGVSVTVKGKPNRVVGALNNSQAGPAAKLPPPEQIEHYLELFSTGEKSGLPRMLEAEEGATRAADFIRGLIDLKRLRRAPGDFETAGIRGDEARLIRGRFFVYRYVADQRLPQPQAERAQPEGGGIQPVLPLKPVPPEIQDGQYYVVAEVTFAFTTVEYGRLNWLALVELESGAVLYLRALASNVVGKVYVRDPITQSGDATRTPDLSNAELDPWRSWQTLPRLGPPDGVGNQSLVGEIANLTEVEALSVAPPTAPAVTGFDYHVRCNEFAAVNAYYHVDQFFVELESLGFDRATYFDGTTFPIQVDHRGMGAAYMNTINAHCVGNGAGGIDHVCYALNDTTDTVNPVGRACDSRVTWHELGGHGVLYDHVNWPNFGFSHSAGDSLSAIRHDPDSKAKDRFRYAPWNPTNLRRFDRYTWNWGGAHDDQGYGSEEILATTLFRVYRSIGGDSANLARRRFASRMTMWLILHTIEEFSEPTNPASAGIFRDTMEHADTDNWTSEGIYGGAYNKVVHWSFEKQGLDGGARPLVDVYIEDVRGGEYTYQEVHWENPSIWNRRNPDGGLTHEPPVPGVPNYGYVKIKNRGTQQAQNVRVRAYHCKPMAGVTWPYDLQSCTTAELAAGTLNPNNSEEKIVGPFEWTPNANFWGHDCMLMIVTADDDASNVDNFAPGEWIPDWRLVPNDNNIGQRNVVFAPAGSLEILAKWLREHAFWVGNPYFNKAAKIQLKVQLPYMLSSRLWKMSFEGLDPKGFELQPHEQRAVVLKLQPGKNLSVADILKARKRDIRVLAFADGLLIGGMTYRLMPELRVP